MHAMNLLNVKVTGQEQTTKRNYGYLPMNIFLKISEQLFGRDHVN